MDPVLDHDMMGLALEEARLALARTWFPVGAVLAAGTRLIASGHKSMGSSHLDHAEMVVLRSAFRSECHYTRQDGLCLCTTLEPCVMCWGALQHLPITRLVFAMDDAYGGCARIPQTALPCRHQARPLAVAGGVRRDEACALFNRFLDITIEPFWVSGGAPEFVEDVRLNGAAGCLTSRSRKA